MESRKFDVTTYGDRQEDNPKLIGLTRREIISKRITYLWLLLNDIMAERGELSNNHPGSKPGNKSPELSRVRSEVSSEIVAYTLLLNECMAEDGDLAKGHVKDAGISVDDVCFPD